MPKDLRAFLRLLEDNNCLLRIKRRLDPRTEMGTLFSETNLPLLFEDIAGYPGWKVCGSLVKNLKAQSMILETSPQEVVSELASRLAAGPTKCKLVSDGPVKEKIIKGDDLDLSRLPVLIHSPQDGGPFIGAGMCITKDLKTGIRNLAMIRMQVKSRNHTGVGMAQRHTWLHYRQYEQANLAMPMAVAIGHHPAYEIATNYTGSYGEDELELAGTLLGEPAEIIRCETIDLEVPAHAEIVLEGEVPPLYREEEGPFGEFTGYSRERPELQPIFRVKAITMRREAIYRHVQGVIDTDHQALVALPMEAVLYQRLKNVGGFLDLKGVHVPTWAGCFVVIIAMTPRFRGEARGAILAALSSPYYHPKVVIAVDDDVDYRNPQELFWSISTRVDPGKDVIVIQEGGVGHPLDISLPLAADSGPGWGPRLGNRLGIDATRPPTSQPEQRSRFQRVMPTGWGRIFLEDLLK